MWVNKTRYAAVFSHYNREPIAQSIFAAFCKIEMAQNTFCIYVTYYRCACIVNTSTLITNGATFFCVCTYWSACDVSGFSPSSLFAAISLCGFTVFFLCGCISSVVYTVACRFRVRREV